MNTVKAAALTMRLKVTELLERNGNPTIYSVAKNGGFSHPTAHKWSKNPDAIKRLDLPTLASFLRGLGYSPEEMAALTIGEVFEIAEDSE